MGLFEVSPKTKHPSYFDMEFLNPSKKIKLDLPNNHDGNIENDDEWGGDDITAEEFDMLETQATQKLAETSSRTFRQPFPVTNGKNKAVSIKEDEKMKQQQYELEGKVKILSDSIAKLSKELNDEKINRDKLIAQKVSQFKVKENTLQKEIQKLESVLQFKNQEMKSVYDKVHILEMQVKEKKDNLEKVKIDVAVKEEKLKETDPQSFKSQDNFLNKFQFSSGSSIHVPGIQNKSNESSFRKYRLQVDTPKGKTTGSGIVSSILCNRLSILPAQNSFISPLITNQNPDALARTSAQISPVSIARLNSDKETSELLDYFDNVLKNYVTHLNGISNRNAVAGPSTTSPLSMRRKESSHDRSFVISILKDLSTFLSCHQFVSIVQRLEFTSVDSKENKKVPKQKDSTQAMNTQQSICDIIHSLFCSLVCLSNSNTYPKTGFVKNEEIEWSLAALISWSFSATQNFLQYVSEIPLASFINSYHSVRSLVLILKLLTNLCTCKGIIPILIHQTDTCVLCSLASLILQKINGSTPEFISVMLLVEDFISTLFTVYSFTELKLNLSPCPSLILQGIVISLWKFCEIHKENTGEFNLIFRKGFTLLHLLSRYFPNFKERRAGFEDNYISLVGRMLTMSKENPLFKDFYDLIHDLWDFQDDTSELDLDEPSEDSVINMDLMSQTSS